MFYHLRAHAKFLDFACVDISYDMRDLFFAEGIKLVHFSDNHFIFLERFSEFGLFGWVVFGVWGLAGRGILIFGRFGAWVRLAGC